MCVVHVYKLYMVYFFPQIASVALDLRDMALNEENGRGSRGGQWVKSGRTTMSREMLIMSIYIKYKIFSGIIVQSKQEHIDM